MYLLVISRLKHVTLQKDGNNTYWRGLLDGWGERSNSWHTSCVPLVWHTSQTVRGGSAWYQHSDLFKINIIAWKCWILNIEHVWIYIGFQIKLCLHYIRGLLGFKAISLFRILIFFSFQCYLLQPTDWFSPFCCCSVGLWSMPWCRSTEDKI